MSHDSPLMRPANLAGKRISIVLAIAVHLLLAVFLFYGVRWQTKATDVVEVELVSAIPQPAAPPPPAPAAVRAPTLAPRPVAEPEPAAPPKPDIAIKEKEKPKPKPEPRPEPKAEVKPRIDPFQEQLKREAEQLNQRKLADAAARDFEQQQAAQSAAASNKAIADYLSRIRGKIRGNIVLPPQVKGNPEAVFDVTQLPSGEIVTVRLRRSSGQAALDTAIERAILKSNPLPKPEQPELFSRSLELRFKPLED